MLINSLISKPSYLLGNKALSLYIHWPFCKAKCPYCDFNSHVREQIEVPRWQEAMLAELRYVAHICKEGYTLTSIFFGGGTPSLMPPTLVKALIDEASALFCSSPTIEITLEANPTSVEAEKFHAFREAGVNRVSLGVQSLHSASLTFLGREHSADEALKAVQLAASVFPRFSFDMIYALPGQTPEQWEKELHEALLHTRGHMSLYQLTIEEQTPFYRRHARGEIILPEDTLAADMYLQTEEILHNAGMLAYEISNYAAPGEECAHNLTYWEGRPFLGIGPGAHGRIVTADGCIASATRKVPERWLAEVEAHGHGMEQWLTLTPQDIYEERIMMGMRLTQGIPLADIEENTLLKATPLIKEKLLERTTTHLRTTRNGKLVLNSMLATLLA